MTDMEAIEWLDNFLDAYYDELYLTEPLTPDIANVCRTALQEKIAENERLNAELERLKNCRHECKIVCLLDKYNKKCAELERVTRERDAAVGDLRGACGCCKHEPTCDIGFGLCEICDHPDECTSPCKDCVDNCNWEWIGPQEVGKDGEDNG